MAGGLKPPPEVLVEWAAKANYVNPETRGDEIPLMEMILLAICYVVVALRLYTRTFVTKSFGWDDALIIFNMLPLTGMAISLYLALKDYGWNRHIYDVPMDMLYPARKLSMCIQIFYLVSTSTTKISILLFYRRLTDRVSTRFQWLLYGVIAFVTCCCISGLITMLVGCRPLNAYWMQVDPNWLAENTGKFTCYDEAAYIVFIATVSMITDFLVCILPMSLFFRLQMNWKRKLALAAIFGVGFFLCICGILRMVKIIETYFKSYDITWSAVTVWVWTGIEAHCAVIIASFPALNHFFRRALKDSSISDRFRSLTHRRYGSRYGSGYNKTHSETTDQTHGEDASDKQAIHVTREIHLEEYSREPKRGYGSGNLQRGVNIDEEAMRKDRRAWLDEATSDDDSINRHKLK